MPRDATHATRRLLGPLGTGLHDSTYWKLRSWYIVARSRTKNPNTGTQQYDVRFVSFDFPLTTQEQLPPDALVADTNLIGYLHSSAGAGDNGSL